ncbi:MAG: tyrosine-type recombinase/integrase [Gemmatimonadota bacterium]
MRKRITKRSVDALRAGARPVFLWDTDVTGFGCKATASGRKVFIFQYRTRTQDSKTAPKRITLGKYGEMTPDRARSMAANLRLEVKAGGDPSAAWRPGESPTVSDLSERFLQEYLPGKKRPPRDSTIRYYETLFRCHVLPELGTVAVGAVTPTDVEKLHGGMRAKPYVANRTLSLLQQAFDQAERWGWRPQHTNPALHIDRYPEERRGAKKEVMLDAEQMAELLKAIEAEEQAGGNPIASAAIRVVFWTGWRIGEVLALEWDNLDLENGLAKLLKTKTAEEEHRQLPTEAVEILEQLSSRAHSRWVFPGRNPHEHLESVRKPWSKIRKRANLDKLPGLGPLRLHDLRHNVVSWDVSRGVPLEIAGKNVGHRSRRSTEVYAHFAPDALKRAADERARAMREAVVQSQKSQPP